MVMATITWFEIEKVKLHCVWARLLTVMTNTQYIFIMIFLIKRRGLSHFAIFRKKPVIVVCI